MTPMKGSLALKQWIHNYNMFLYQKLYWRIVKNAGANLSVYARIMSICWITTNFTDSLGICFDSSLRVLDAWETIYKCTNLWQWFIYNNMVYWTAWHQWVISFLLLCEPAYKRRQTLSHANDFNKQCNTVYPTHESTDIAF